MKPQHTPLPWNLTETMLNGETTKENIWIEDEQGNAIFVMPTLGGRRYEQQMADAAFIVRAVNAHEELVGAVKEALCLLDPDCNYDGSNADDMPDNDRKEIIVGLYKILENADETIAKAEGK